MSKTKIDKLIDKMESIAGKSTNESRDAEIQAGRSQSLEVKVIKNKRIRRNHKAKSGVSCEAKVLMGLVNLEYGI